jgi:hypothetical protein
MADEIKTPIPSDEFHLGITMAGAVSAGCYTGGVMDYLFEILDLWERAKKGTSDELKNDADKIPRHKAIIDAMGGASAGGMTTSMSVMYALNGKINAIKNPSAVGGIRNNIFYDSWVLLDDENPKDKRKTFEKAWDLNDLKEGKVKSILNSAFIDSIADRTFNTTGVIKEKVESLPSYISKDLEMILSHCMLRGIPMEVDFSTPIGRLKGANVAPSHSTFEHLTVSYYKLNKGEKPVSQDNFLWLNPFEAPYIDTLRLATKATGAFPLGLSFREFTKKDFTDNYLKNIAEKIIFRSFGKQASNEEFLLNWKAFPTPFDFITVDGGTLNNEPFGEVLSILKSRYGDSVNEKDKQYGLIMVDPFPDFAEKQDAYTPPDDLISMVPALVRTLRDQSKVKRTEMLEAYSNSYLRGVIFPVKWKARNDKQKYPIACESVAAFGGFLDINFRHHDFFLGRNNARNFFRFYFTFEYNKEQNIIHPIHKNWTDDMIKIFKVERGGKTYLPIIPDLNLIIERNENRTTDPFSYHITDMPSFDPQSLFDLRGKMEDRFQKMLELSMDKLNRKKQQPKGSAVEKYMQVYYPKNWLDKLKGWAIDKSMGIVFDLTKGGLARSITQAALKWMVSDLEAKGFLKPPSK